MTTTNTTKFHPPRTCWNAAKEWVPYPPILEEAPNEGGWDPITNQPYDPANPQAEAPKSQTPAFPDSFNIRDFYLQSRSNADLFQLIDTFHLSIDDTLRLLNSEKYQQILQCDQLLKDLQFRHLAQTHRVAALEVLVGLMHQTQHPEVARRAAANLLALSGISPHSVHPTPNYFAQHPKLSPQATEIAPFEHFTDPLCQHSGNFYDILERIHLHLPLSRQQWDAIAHGPDYNTCDDIVQFLTPAQSRLWYHARRTGILPPFPLHYLPEFQKMRQKIM